MSQFSFQGVACWIHPSVVQRTSLDSGTLYWYVLALDPSRRSSFSPLAGIDYDNRTKKQGVYKIVGKGHKGWSPNVDKELGNYDYLLGADVKTFIRPLVLTSLTLAVGRSSAPRCPKRYERLVRLDLTGLSLRSESRCPEALMNGSDHWRFWLPSRCYQAHGPRISSAMGEQAEKVAFMHS